MRLKKRPMAVVITATPISSKIDGTSTIIPLDTKILKINAAVSPAEISLIHTRSIISSPLALGAIARTNTKKENASIAVTLNYELTRPISSSSSLTR